MQRTSIASISQKKTAAVILAIACTFGSATLASSAQAGRYHVYSCRTPSGEPAPTDGWTGSVTGSFDYDLNTCAEGGALVAALGSGAARTANTSYATWEFSVPQGEKLAAATLWRAGDTGGGTAENTTYLFSLAGPEDVYDSANVFDNCVSFEACASQGISQTPLSESNRVVVPEANLNTHLYAVAACGGVTGYDCPDNSGDGAYASIIRLFAADLILEEDSLPTVNGLSGPLAESAVVSGSSDLRFNASDDGAGIYDVRVSVDGQQVLDTIPDSNYGHCQDLGTTADGLPAFLYTQPCPSTESIDIRFESTKLTNGEHEVVVSVDDAAGNSTVVLDRYVTVANGQQLESPAASSNAIASLSSGSQAVSTEPNGTDASAQARLIAHWNHTHKTHLAVGFGHAETIMGRLTTDAGTPIAGAQIDVSDVPSYEGARTSTMKSPRTGANGQFAVRLPAGVSSRTLHLSYRARLADVVPAATSTLVLSVRPRIVFRVTPTVSHRGGTIWFVGRLWGSPIPPGGKQLVLEARSGHGPWIEFHVIRTAKNGSFRSHYRFRLGGPITYQFRIVSNFEADFPFTSGASGVDRVYER